MDVIERVLREFTTLAIVGVSRDPSKSAYSVPESLQAVGYRVVPVNPSAAAEGVELLGQKTYADLASIPFPVEVVVVFRPSAEAAAVTRAAVAVGARAVWLQQGIASDEARSIAEAAGLLYVEDRCFAVERALHRVVPRRGE